MSELQSFGFGGTVCAGSVRVFCRVRPLAHTNSLHAQSSPVTVEQERITVKAAGIKREFGADRVFGQESTQGNNPYAY
jgi:hypothetical protein